MDSTQIDPVRPRKRHPVDQTEQLRQLGPYRLLRLLGVGGMGAVYLGYDSVKNEHVAIKVLSDELVENKLFIERFYREGAVGATLHHPNIVQSLRCGQDEGSGKHYLVLEYVDGPSARGLLLCSEVLDVGDAIHIALNVARALEHTHARNIVHRDIKPDNLLLTRSGVCKLADFGLAKLTNEVSHLTGTRQVFGTSLYMPYEQAINARYVDGRSDIYALGATLYHLITGEPPFLGEDHLEIIEKKSEGVYPPATQHNPAVPKGVDKILTKMLARHPSNRYQTASELIIDLERSNLASEKPSFADADLLQQDPWFQVVRAMANEPTRPAIPKSLRQTSSRPTAPKKRQWLVRFRHPDGQLCKARATPNQILQRLKEDRLPGDAEVCRNKQEGFLPLKTFKAFRSELERADLRSTKVEPTGNSSHRDQSSAAIPTPRWQFPWLVATTGVVLAVLLGVLYWHW